MTESSVIFLLVGVLLLGIVLVLYMTVFRKEAPGISREKYQTRWLELENSLSRDNIAACQLAILTADKLLDQALKDGRYKGETMAERMKSAGKKWTKANSVWTAHKIRNRLAHEPDAAISYELALQTLGAYKQALKDLGAI